MKDGLKQVLGRQVAAVIVAASEKGPPRHQVFLVFTDGTSFEFYGEAFTCCGGVDRQRDIARHVASGGGKVVAVYTDQGQATLPAAQDLEALMTQDLAAWKLAKQTVFRAKRWAEGEPGHFKDPESPPRR